MDDRSLSETIELAKKNNQKAFNNLFEEFWGYLYNYQLKKNYNQDRAEDISIRAMAKAFDRIETFNSKYKFKTWLIAISNNIKIDDYRKEVKNLLRDRIEYPDSQKIIDETLSPEDKLIRNQKFEDLLTKIKSLKKDYSQIIKLRFFNELSYKEISEITNQPINTVKVKIMRAKKFCQRKSKMVKNFINKLGPGLLFAGAAIGVSHLVQSTRAGADYGWGLLWALLIVNLLKYPFFQFGPRYAIATNKSLIEGYYELGKFFLISYFILNIATMFTIQTAVTIVTASLASKVFGLTSSLVVWSLIVTFLCLSILFIGKYKLLDNLIKWIIVTLSISTIFALIVAVYKNDSPIQFDQIFPNSSNLIFLIAFMGWMPAPLDISIWHSLWAIEKKRIQKKKSN